MTDQRRVRWSQNEDLALCKSFINVSEDPIAGTDQRASIFWSTIFEKFKAQVEADNSRTETALQSRWVAINKLCKKFSGYFGEVQRSNPSGTTEEDMTKMALDNFKEGTSKSFPFHAYVFFLSLFAFYDLNK